MMITRCPACGTMFNVVADQLKVSQGWVRCGHCSDIFDASLHLQEPRFEADEDADFKASLAFAADPTLQSPSSNAEGESDLEDDFERSLQAAINASAVAKKLSEDQPAPIPRMLPALLPAPLLPRSVEPAAQTPAAESSRALLSEEIEAEDSAAAANSVSFVKDARRQEFWKKVWVRGAVAGLALCLLVALLLQVVIHQKDHLVALAPPLKPLVQAVCQQLGCELAPLRKIGAVVIDSSTFTKLGLDSYKLNFSIKNTSPMVLAMPSLEVTLTDLQDQPLLRRVLLPEQFGAGATGGDRAITNSVTAKGAALLAPGVEFAGSITLEVSAAGESNALPVAPRVTGYRLLAFYP